MKKNLIIILFLFSVLIAKAEELKYPFLYIPGLFDNGDLFNEDYKLVKVLNNEDGFYYKNYFNDVYNYSEEKLICSSNIINSKYNRLIVANLIGPYRTNIPMELMSERLFALIQGKAPNGKLYNGLINYKGNDYSGYCMRDNKKIYFNGIVEELWAKYGKKVFYKKEKNKFKVILFFKNNKNLFYFENKNGYFDSPDEIKLNVIAHSSGGVALRRYLEICKNENIDGYINLIINLSVPQKGARMNYQLKKAFPELIKIAVDKFISNKDKGVVVLKDDKKYTYKELLDKTIILDIYGESPKAKELQNLIGNYILYNVPFDGYKSVLGRDPALYDLYPDHKFIKKLNKASIPESIKIYNYKVISPYSKFFGIIAECLGLNQNDGVVDVLDTDLDQIRNYDKLFINNIYVMKANHILFPYIKPVFEMRSTIESNYSFLKIIVKNQFSKQGGLDIIEALFFALMNEFGLDLDNILKNENYSVIDYFGDNPVNITK